MFHVLFYSILPYSILPHASNCIQPHPVTKWHEWEPRSGWLLPSGWQLSRHTPRRCARSFKHWEWRSRCGTLNCLRGASQIFILFQMFHVALLGLSHRLKKQKGRETREKERWIVIIQGFPNPQYSPLRLKIVGSRCAIQGQWFCSVIWTQMKHAHTMQYVSWRVLKCFAALIESGIKLENARDFMHEVGKNGAVKLPHSDFLV